MSEEQIAVQKVLVRKILVRRGINQRTVNDMMVMWEQNYPISVTELIERFTKVANDEVLV